MAVCGSFTDLCLNLQLQYLHCNDSWFLCPLVLLRLPPSFQISWSGPLAANLSLEKFYWSVPQSLIAISPLQFSWFLCPLRLLWLTYFLCKLIWSEAWALFFFFLQYYLHTYSRSPPPSPPTLASSECVRWFSLLAKTSSINMTESHHVRFLLVASYVWFGQS